VSNDVQYLQKSIEELNERLAIKDRDF